MIEIKILMFTPSFLPLTGGMEVKIYEISRWLTKHYNEVFLMTIRRGSSPRKERLEGIEIERFILTGPFVIPRLLQFVFAKKIDVVHVHWSKWKTGLLAVLIAKILGKPVILGLAGDDVYTPADPDRRPGFVYMHLVEMADLLVTTSEDLKRRAIEKGFPRNAVAIPQGIDTKKFNPIVSGRNVRETLDWLDNPIVMAAARLIERKGIAYLVDAFAQVLREEPDAKLMIAGEGPERRRLEEKVKRLGLSKSVSFLGIIPYREVSSYYAACDVFVHIPTYEAMPHVIYEAMATGKPVVASRVGGILEVIEHGKDGLLVEPKAPSETAEAILKLIHNRRLAGEVGENALQKIERRYTWDIIAGQYLRLYRYVASHRDETDS
ncbi:MAG: glycosyltransferase family 4 protein [Candidatus Bathyarchaeota archaeon]|nr:MAG: glycosyltransferase family 4 protein [Candidatus Bathyarchaeota archaeon]